MERVQLRRPRKGKSLSPSPSPSPSVLVSAFSELGKRAAWGPARAAQRLAAGSGPWCLALRSSGLVTVSIFRLGVAAPARSRGRLRGAGSFDRFLGWDEAAYGTRRRRMGFPSDAGERAVRLCPTGSWGLGGQSDRLVCLRRMGPIVCVSLSRIPRSNVAPGPAHTHTHPHPRRCVTGGACLTVCPGPVETPSRVTRQHARSLEVVRNAVMPIDRFVCDMHACVSPAVPCDYHQAISLAALLQVLQSGSLVL